MELFRSPRGEKEGWAGGEEKSVSVGGKRFCEASQKTSEKRKNVVLSCWI
jgi:hypothetical protein